VEGKSVWTINGIIKEKQKYSEKTLNQCQCVNHKFHTDWPGIELSLLQWKANY
jgi:hypothetical protein